MGLEPHIPTDRISTVQSNHGFGGRGDWNLERIDGTRLPAEKKERQAERHLGDPTTGSIWRSLK